MLSKSRRRKRSLKWLSMCFLESKKSHLWCSLNSWGLEKVGFQWKYFITCKEWIIPNAILACHVTLHRDHLSQHEILQMLKNYVYMYMCVCIKFNPHRITVRWILLILFYWWSSERLRNLPKFAKLVANRAEVGTQVLCEPPSFPLFCTVLRQQRAHSQNSEDWSTAESAVNFKGHTPEFEPYSVTTGSHYRFGGKKANLKSWENSAAEKERVG